MMAQEQKQLLVKDISARLAYGVKAKVSGHINPLQILGISKLHKGSWAWKKGSYVVSFWNDTKAVEAIKPYLRPMSSMTEGEREEYSEINDTLICQWDDCGRFIGFTYAHSMIESIDWLNAHHFDYRGLIDKCLALEAPEGMYGENC